MTDTLSPEKVSVLVHELQVHQIELELQNKELRRTQAELQATQARYFDLYDRAPVGYVTVNQEGLVLQANLTCAGLLGVTCSELVNQAFSRFIIKEDQDRYYLMRQRTQSANEQHSCELRLKKSDGAALWAHLDGVAAHDEAAGPVLHITLADISQRMQAQIALMASEEKYRLMAENSSDGIIQFDADNHITYASPAYMRLFGFTQAQTLAHTPELIYDLIHPNDRDTLFSRTFAAIASKTPSLRYSFRVKHALGHYIWREDHTCFSFDEQGNYTGCLAICRDITERQQMQEALQAESHKASCLVCDLSARETELTEARQQLRQLAVQNELAREAQLKHIAREVHDELGQLLTALRMDMSLLEMRFGALDPSLIPQVNGSKALIDRAIGAVRQVAASLRPPEIDLGLVPALDYLCREFGQHSGIDCVLKVDSPEIILDEARAVVIYRIVQESLTNVARYAQASVVSVSLRLDAQQLELEVRDNGQGFDMTHVAARHTLGLLGMRERALALGGHLDVISAPGQGAVVAAQMPLKLETAADPT
jgi:PAS domain S-box-containing protein